MRSVLLILSFVFLLCFSCKKDAEKQSEPSKEELIDVESVNEIEEETEKIIEKMTAVPCLFRVPLFSLINKDTIRKFAEQIPLRH